MENKEKNFASAVIYVHNSEDRIEAFLRTIIEVMEDHFEHSEIVCVNDASDDRSLEMIKSTSVLAHRTSVSVINMSYFHGIELAMTAGVDMAIGDFVFEFDRTILDFEPELIMNVYRRSLKGFDIVSAAPEKMERVSSKLFYGVFRHFAEISGELSTESFRVLSRRAINRISSMNKTVPYRKVVYANCGLKTDKIRYLSTQRHAVGSDRKEERYRTDLAIDSLILFTNLGYEFSVRMTVLMMAISLFMVLYSVVVYVTGNPVEGWTTTILFLSVAFLGLFGILTIIVKYLQLLVEMVFKRKHYSFESIEKLTK